MIRKAKVSVWSGYILLVKTLNYTVCAFTRHYLAQRAFLVLTGGGVITCYYFHESAFYSYRNSLDGAILTDGETAQLCINSLSARVEKFRESELVIGLSNGLCDPQNLEGLSDHVLIADCDIDRKMSDQVLSYLQRKYNLDHLQAIPMQQHAGIIGVSKDKVK